MPTSKSAAAVDTPEAKRSFWVTEQSVYGIVLVSGLLLLADEKSENSWNSFFLVVATVLIFWAAHVFAAFVAHPRFLSGDHSSLGTILGHALRQERGLLVAALIPCGILLLGSTGLLDDQTAIELALWSGVGILAVLGYVAFSRAGYGWVGRVVGTVITMSFGIMLIIAKALFH